MLDLWFNYLLQNYSECTRQKWPLALRPVIQHCCQDINYVEEGLGKWPGMCVRTLAMFCYRAKCCHLLVIYSSPSRKEPRWVRDQIQRLVYAGQRIQFIPCPIVQWPVVHTKQHFLTLLLSHCNPWSPQAFRRLHDGSRQHLLDCNISSHLVS